ncbi:TPA: hypothetical protein ACKP7H_002182 [Serratia marcescens]|jgi:hypothetical protein|uniref:hypothetical protein n=1 Tax=Serratia marcescens TaxID=615 RepID=UPI0014278D42|nr:hypothetical protein [Serratia marcescens]QIR66740.1 hypothetical protein HCG50_15495 [Serratia marcescens]
MSIYAIDNALGVPTFKLRLSHRKTDSNALKLLIFYLTLPFPSQITLWRSLPAVFIRLSPRNDDLSQSPFYRFKSMNYLSQPDDSAGWYCR